LWDLDRRYAGQLATTRKPPHDGSVPRRTFELATVEGVKKATEVIVEQFLCAFAKAGVKSIKSSTEPPLPADRRDGFDGIGCVGEYTAWKRCRLHGLFRNRPDGLPYAIEDVKKACWEMGHG